MRGTRAQMVIEEFKRYLAGWRMTAAGHELVSSIENLIRSPRYNSVL